MCILELNRVWKTYETVQALAQIDLQVGKGEWVSIMGPSGSGKSTLLNIISCLDTPTRGRVLIDGADVSTLNSRQLAEIRRDKIGLVFQQFHLVPYLTALENVMLAQYYHSLPDESEARLALGRVGLGERLRHFPRQLSGGEQQRVCIARALINCPALILADEPTGNLDANNARAVMDLFRELHDEGHTVITVTHDPKVGGLAGRRIRLEHGRIVNG